MKYSKLSAKKLYIKAYRNAFRAKHPLKGCKIFVYLQLFVLNCIP